MNKKLLYSIFFLFVVNTSFATHNMAGDISYTYVGTVSNPYAYKITVQTYTKWIGSSGTDRCEIMIYSGDGDSTLAPRVNGPSLNCSPPNKDGVLIGGCTGNTRHNIYEIIHNYAGPGDYFISVEDPNRSSGICNIPSPSDDYSFHLEAELIINAFIGNNSAPAYTEVPVICPEVSVPYYYNPLAIDSDGDSLYYELITPMAYGGYITGYILPNSSTSFSIDTSTVIWNAPVMICNYVFAIRIHEWRKIAGFYYNLGSTMQEVWSVTTPYTGISENTSSTSLNIFPNPSNGLININIENGLENQDYQIVISNSLGQIIKTMDITNNTATINENELSSGIYFYSLSDKTQILNKGKFVILSGNMK